MRYRQSSKLKLQHRIIVGLLELLKQVSSWTEVDTVFPGKIARTGNISPRCRLHVQYKTPSGLKCLAKSGNEVQEVFLVTSCQAAVAKKLAEL